MKIKDRLDRQDNEDIIIIGEAVEAFLRSDAGEIFHLMISNLQKLEMQNSRNGSISAERALGRIEAYETVISDFQTFVDRKYEIQRPVETAPPETEVAEEITRPLTGGEV